jgi:hypothetical protein
MEARREPRRGYTSGRAARHRNRCCHTCTAAGCSAVTRKPRSVADLPYTCIAVDKRAKYVDVENQGEQPQDLAGWILVSEKGNQACPLGGIIRPAEVLRIWALSTDVGQEGFNCGFDANIWNNGEADPAVLYDVVGREVSRH